MSDFILYLIRTTPSLLLVAKYFPVVILVIILLTLSACTVTHDYGHLPKVKVDNPYADDTSVKIRKDEIRVVLEWEI